MVQGTPNVAVRDQAALASGTALGFQEVCDGIRDGATEGEASITMRGDEVGLDDSLYGAAPWLRRFVSRCHAVIPCPDSPENEARTGHGEDGSVKAPGLTAR